MATDLKPIPGYKLVNISMPTCRDCGHIIQCGESMSRCSVCGSENIGLEKDPDKWVLLSCSP